MPNDSTSLDDATFVAGLPARSSCSEFVTANDLQALDVIGLDLASVPEPSSFLRLGAAGMCILARRRDI